MISPTQASDLDSQASLQMIAEEEKIRANRIENVKTVLVIFSSRAMIFDRHSLEQKIHLSYPGSKVYFETTLGYPMGERAPKSLDLVIDFTGPMQRHKWFYARSLRNRARVCVGRNAWFFREYVYDRVFDESTLRPIRDVLVRERAAQKAVLELAGVPVSTKGELGRDLSKKIAVSLPRLKK